MEPSADIATPSGTPPPVVPTDPVTEFVPVSILATIPTGMFVNPKKIPANNVAEFIAYARANPGKVTAATQGIGTTSHLTSEWFQLAANVKFVQVPYRGSAPALQGLVAGDVDIMFDNLPRIEEAEYEIVLRVHDEVVTEAPDVPEFNAEHLSSLLATNHDWCPDLPLAAAGFCSTRYRKD